MKHKIWSYWETKPGSFRPEYLDLCEETWRKHCGDDFQICRVTAENVAEYAPNLIEEWNRLPVLAHKADYLRAVLVYEHGGIWLDKFRVFFETVNLKDVSRDDCDLREDTLVVYLYNAMFPAAFKRLTRNEILRGDAVISQIFRKALDIDDRGQLTAAIGDQETT